MPESGVPELGVRILKLRGRELHSSWCFAFNLLLPTARVHLQNALRPILKRVLYMPHELVRNRAIDGAVIVGKR